MNKCIVDLIELLSDGEIYLIDEICFLLDINQNDVCDGIRQIKEMGVSIEILKFGGVRLLPNIDELNTRYINENYLSIGLTHCEVFKIIDSTNSFLMRNIGQNKWNSGSSVIAEFQTDGRGRRGKIWVSSYAQNISCSLLWGFEKSLEQLGGLSLVIGISIVEALEIIGIIDLKVKWPNDVLIGNRKLAGTLIEVSSEVNGIVNLIIGIGINVAMNENHKDVVNLDQAWVSANDLSSEQINRSQLFLLVMEKTIKNLNDFQIYGFSFFGDRWSARAAYIGQNVFIKNLNTIDEGVYEGVTESGELILCMGNAKKIFNSGEVSLRISNDFSN